MNAEKAIAGRAIFKTIIVRNSLPLLFIIFFLLKINPTKIKLNDVNIAPTKYSSVKISIIIFIMIITV